MMPIYRCCRCEFRVDKCISVSVVVVARRMVSYWAVHHAASQPSGFGQVKRYRDVAPRYRAALVVSELRVLTQRLMDETDRVPRFVHQHMRTALDAQEAMFRIRDTPVPPAYTHTTQVHYQRLSFPVDARRVYAARVTWCAFPAANGDEAEL
jgi:hypothetical protein